MVENVEAGKTFITLREEVTLDHEGAGIITRRFSFARLRA